ncbi:MAG: M14 family zinc carboxypeptidase [Mobilitalea sp.]
MIIDFNESFYSYDRLITDAKKLAIQYENILQCVTIGKSHDNRDIVLLKLGVGQKYLICCAGVHAREIINPIVMMRIVEYYADLYVNHKQQKINLRKQLNNPTLHLGAEYEQMLYGACIYELLQTFTILFVPLLNPDGYMISLSGFDIIRNQQLKNKCLALRITKDEWKLNARGIDINRNFPSQLWKPKQEKDYAASENETKALIFLFHEYKSSGFLDFHSRGKSIYYYRSLMTGNYNKKQYEIASRFKEITNYELVPPENEIDAGDTGGNTVHYYSEHFHKPALTIETVDEDATFPLEEQYRSSTFEELKLVIFEFGSMII